MVLGWLIEKTRRTIRANLGQIWTSWAQLGDNGPRGVNHIHVVHHIRLVRDIHVVHRIYVVHDIYVVLHVYQKTSAYSPCLFCPVDRIDMVFINKYHIMKEKDHETYIFRLNA